MRLILLIAVAAPLVGFLIDDSVEEGRVEYRRDVRPILSKNCFQCHGPDAAARQARLRLDRRSVDDGRGILVPGRPFESELVRRITATDDDERMPPLEAKRFLTQGEIALLTRWVEEGAEFEDHWAYLPATNATPPLASEWARTPIDRYVDARLHSKGLTPSPEADRRTLIRRLTFDLTGMPASPADVAGFVDDTEPDAYERVVDRLLASKAYAERMTVAWMDAARYGDTSVFHADGPRDMWAWRDWVIDAYDSNMSFDRFTTEQLAGDLMPDSTRDQKIAVGFLRNNGTSDEGGAIDEELRVGYVVERVKTTANVWLGLSMECAQCHDHKFDPITQEDYYRFYAYFNQSEEKGFQSRAGNEAPLVLLPSSEQQADDERLARAIEVLEAELLADTSAASSSAALASWKSDQRTKLRSLVPPVESNWYSLGPFEAESSQIAFETRFGPESSPRSAVELTASVGEVTWIERPEWNTAEVHDFPPADNAATYLYRTLTVDEATRRSISLGSDDTLQVWLNGDELLSEEVYRGAAPDQDEVVLDLTSGVNHLILKVVNGSGPSGFYYRLLGLPLPDDVAEALLLDADTVTAEQAEAIAAHYARAVSPAGIARVERLDALVAERAELTAAIPTVMTMQDLADGRMTYVLGRGQYDAPREDRPVDPGVLEFLLPQRAGAPANRLGLARWLVDPGHPLTARVAVNRYWAMLFGTGIVETVMDFGSQGSWPSHPALLDHLAREFVESGWDVKRMLKNLVTSATYRQSSRGREELARVDPRNTLLGRGPRFRLQAEFLRDQALAVAGLLIDQVGGPSTRPYQPSGLWNEVSLDKNVRFMQDEGDALYRKSMYIYWKRSAPMPAMTAFDAPTRETCVVQRQRTNTPLQALVTLNDVQFVEAARRLARRMILGGADFDARLDVGFELCTARPADATRRDVMRSVFDEERERFDQAPERATALLEVGDTPRDETLDAAEHAAWTVIASMLLNLDETLNRE